MLYKAIKKIETEMEKEKNPYVKVIGDFLLNHLANDPGAAEQILADDKKTIFKSIDAMRKAASKNKTGNCAMLSDAEGYEVVLKYFGIKKKANEPIKKSEEEKIIDIKSIKQKKVEEKPIEFKVDLNDYLDF